MAEYQIEFVIETPIAFLMKRNFSFVTSVAKTHLCFGWIIRRRLKLKLDKHVLELHSTLNSKSKLKLQLIRWHQMK